MTIKDLKELIKDLPDDMEIILSKDAEGNHYSPLSSGDPECYYEPETTWYGEVYDADLDRDDSSLTDEEWEEISSKPKVLVLSPVN